MVRQVPALATFGVVIGFIVWTFVGFLSRVDERAQETARQVVAAQVRAAESQAAALGELSEANRTLADSVNELRESMSEAR